MTHGQIDRQAQRARNRASVQRYRSKHRRIDYVPSDDVLRVIEGWLSKNLSNCHAGVIDQLILAGHRAMSGNAGPAHLLTNDKDAES